MDSGISISGLDDCLKFFDDSPAKMVKVTRQCLRKGGQASSRYIKGRMDKRWRYLAKNKVTKLDNGNYNAVFGLFNGKQADGHQPANGQVATWFKAYWRNYGTLEGRDPDHQFERPVKRATTQAAQNRRNRTGEAHTNFFEQAIVGYEKVFVEAFEAEMSNKIDEVY